MNFRQRRFEDVSAEHTLEALDFDHFLQPVNDTLDDER